MSEHDRDDPERPKPDAPPAADRPAADEAPARDAASPGEVAPPPSEVEAPPASELEPPASELEPPASELEPPASELEPLPSDPPRSIGPDLRGKRRANAKGPLGLSKNALRRLALYPPLVIGPLLAAMYCTIMPGSSHSGPLPALSADDQALARRLEADVRALAASPRALEVVVPDGENGRVTSLARAETWVRRRFVELGYTPARLSYDVGITSVANLEVTIRGDGAPSEIVVIGAHYDSVQDGPGADDNASGVAALLALAQAFSGKKTTRTLRFVAFANEEPPRFWTETMGSLVYARACRARDEDVRAMLSLESLGYYSEAPKSQRYPALMSLLYPSTGSFVAFIGNTSSRTLTRESLGVFRKSVAFPSEGAALPAFINGVGWSDQWSFWQVGYPAFMVTDTAVFRNPAYHTPGDTPDTLDYGRLARVVRGLEAVVASLAGAR